MTNEATTMHDEQEARREGWDVSGFEALHFFIAAVHAVAPDSHGLPNGSPLLEIRSGRELWDWCLGNNPVAGMLVADLSEEQQQTVREVLDRMVRERSGGNGAADLTAPLNIGVGTK